MIMSNKKELTANEVALNTLISCTDIRVNPVKGFIAYFNGVLFNPYKKIAYTRKGDILNFVRSNIEHTINIIYIKLYNIGTARVQPLSYGEARIVQILQDNGIDLVTMANNANNNITEYQYMVLERAERENYTEILLNYFLDHKILEIVKLGEE